MRLISFSIYNIVMGGKYERSADRTSHDIRNKGCHTIYLRPEAKNMSERVTQYQVINQTSGRKLPAYALGKANGRELEFDVHDVDVEKIAKVKNAK